MKVSAFSKVSSSATQQKAEEQGRGSFKAPFAKTMAGSRQAALLSSGSKPLALVYKTALESLNDILAPELGPNAIQQAYDSGLDVSPEATAKRIISQSTGFFQAYQKQHPDKDLETAAQDFVELIGSGIERGFAEAREILSGLDVLQGEVAANIDRTYDLVQEGLKGFLDSTLSSARDSSA